MCSPPPPPLSFFSLSFYFENKIYDIRRQLREQWKDRRVNFALRPLVLKRQRDVDAIVKKINFNEINSRRSAHGANKIPRIGLQWDVWFIGRAVLPSSFSSHLVLTFINYSARLGTSRRTDSWHIAIFDSLDHVSVHYSPAYQPPRRASTNPSFRRLSSGKFIMVANRISSQEDGTNCIISIEDSNANRAREPIPSSFPGNTISLGFPFSMYCTVSPPPSLFLARSAP